MSFTPSGPSPCETQIRYGEIILRDCSHVADGFEGPERRPPEQGAPRNFAIREARSPSYSPSSASFRFCMAPNLETCSEICGSSHLFGTPRYRNATTVALSHCLPCGRSDKKPQVYHGLAVKFHKDTIANPRERGTQEIFRSLCLQYKAANHFQLGASGEGDGRKVIITSS